MSCRLLEPLHIRQNHQIPLILVVMIQVQTKHCKSLASRVSSKQCCRFFKPGCKYYWTDDGFSLAVLHNRFISNLSISCLQSSPGAYAGQQSHVNISPPFRQEMNGLGNGETA